MPATVKKTRKSSKPSQGPVLRQFRQTIPVMAQETDEIMSVVARTSFAVPCPAATPKIAPIAIINSVLVKFPDVSCILIS